MQVTHNSWAAALLAATAFSAPATAQDAQTIRVAESGVNASIHPGDDFFAFANGAWLEATEIPEGQERWNARTEIDALTRQQVAKLFDLAATAPMGSYARQIADFRAAYSNESAIERSP